MIGNELERHLLLVYIKEVEENGKLAQAMSGIGDSKKLALFITDNYSRWLVKKRTKTTDECFDGNVPPILDLFKSR